MDKYIESGANAFKFVLNPVYCDIEYERVNNYYDRMHQAWELDKLINTAEQNDLKMQFNMQLQTTWQFNASGASKWHWSNTSDYQGDPVWEGNRGNCYWQDLGLDALNPYEFFTSEEARKQYKKKIRYIVARWGYTPNIYLWEIFSEINGVGSGDTFPYVDNLTEGIQGEFDGADEKGDGIQLPKPYDTDYTTKRQIISEWTNEIFSYLTYDLGVRQLMTCSYTGLAPLNLNGHTPQELGSREDRDRTWENPLCDAVCWSEYDHTLTRIESRGKNHYVRGEILPSASSFSSLNKPLLLGENGVGDPVMNCDYTGYINDLLTYPFSGYASAGMSWDEQNSSEYWLWMGRVDNFLNSSFFNTTNIGEGNWIPQHQFIYANPIGAEIYGEYFDNEPPYYERPNESTSALVEAVCLMNGEGTQSIGILINRTWNWWNQSADDVECGESLVDETLECCHEGQFIEISSEGYNLRIEGFGSEKRFKIIYYDPRTNEILDTQWNYSSLTGRLNLEDCPDLSEDRPWCYFKAFHDPYIGNDESFSRLETNSLQQIREKVKFSEESFHYFAVSPNPCSEILYFHSENSMGNMAIFDFKGMEVLRFCHSRENNWINVENVAAGIYKVVQLETGLSQTFVIN